MHIESYPIDLHLNAYIVCSVYFDEGKEWNDRNKYNYRMVKAFVPFFIAVFTSNHLF